MKNYLCIIGIFALLMTAIPAVSYRKTIQSISSDEQIQSNAETSFQTEETAETVCETTADSADTKDKTNIFLVLDISSGEIVEVSDRDYVIGAVCAEMPATFETEAIKAQAVAAHTYAVKQRSNELENPSQELKGAYISNDSSKYQAFFTEEQTREYFGDNFDEYYSKISDAVDSVLNEILVYDDEPIVAAFHSMSSGKTESAENIFGNAVDYLVPVDSAEDINAPKYLTEYEFTSDEIYARLKEAYPDIQLPDDKSKWIAVRQRTASDTVTSVDIGNINISGWELRTLLSLRSASFNISYDNGIFTFETHGYGHGVGMSQYGANAMAQQGFTYNEILEHYYKGAELSKI
jgi:stage II sporulation protein D